MADLLDLTTTRARTGTFHGTTARDEDTYFAAFAGTGRPARLRVWARFARLRLHRLRAAPARPVAPTHA